MTRAFPVLLVPFLLGFWVSTARAQDRTGGIEGTVYDDMGMPMAGARVSAESPTQIGGPRQTTSDAEGGFRFLGLIPGAFTVKVSKPGFLGSVRKGLRVGVGKTLTLDVLLDRQPERKPSGLPDEDAAPGQPAAPKPKAETYVITAARPVVDVTSSSTGDSLSDEYLENLPVLNRTSQGIASMTPTVTTERDPKGDGQGNPSVAGGAYFNNNYYVDGMDTTDPVTHTFATNFNFDAMSDVQVLTGGMGPEHSDTVGGVINMVTKSGSNTFELDSSIYYQDAALTAQDPEDGERTFRNLDFNLNVGGPLVRDRLWYYASFELNQATRQLPYDPVYKMPQHPARDYLGGKALVKLTFQASPKHKLVFWAQGAPASISNTSQLITVEPDAEGHQDQYNVLSTLAWEWLAGERTFVKTQLGFGWNGLRVYPQSGVDDVYQIRDVGTGITRQNFNRTLVDDRYRISLNSQFTHYLDDLLGDHEIKAGFRLQYLENPSEEGYTGHMELINRFGQPYSRTRYFLDFDQNSACDQTSAKYDAQKCRQGTLETTVSGLKLIAFLQDQWKMPGYKRLRLLPGVAFHFGNTQNPDGDTVTSFVTATPHLNFAWDLFGDGKTVLRGGYNQYVDTGFLALARFIGRDFTSYTCNYDETIGDYSASCRIGGQTRTVGMPQGPTYNADGTVKDKFNPDALSVPRTHELNFGGEREWLAGFSTGLDFQYRLYQNQWEDVETNVIWNEAGDSAQAFKNGKSEYIYDLETPDEAYRRYIGLSIFARKFLGPWQLMASYTWSRYEGTVSEGYATTYLDRARQAQFYDGFLPDDRRHVLKLSGWYTWRKELTVGGSFWLGTGTPYDKFYFNSFFNDYSDRRAVRGMDPKDLANPDDDEELRTPTRVVLNLKLSYRLGRVSEWLFGERIDLEAIGEMFNLFNLRTATNFEDRDLASGAATQFGDVLDRQDPFRVRFGLRYRY